MNRPPLPCPLCAALVLDDEAHVTRHAVWHDEARPWSADQQPTWQALVRRFHEVRDFARLADDDAPTTRLPPITDTVGLRRRPPPPTVRALNDRAELIRAMSEELARELQELEDDATEGDGQ